MFGIFKKKKKEEKKSSKEKTKESKKSEAKEKNSKKEEVLFVTNSAALPEIKVGKFATEEKNKAVFMIMFAGELSRNLKKLKGSKISNLAYSVIGEKGILEVPAKIEHNGKETAILIYEKADKESAGKFKAAKKFLKDEYRMDAVYYAPKKLDLSAPAKNPFRIMNERIDLFPKPKEILKGNYAMWFSSGKEDKFIGSKCCKHMKRAYKAMEGIETFILCAIGKALEFYKGEHFRVNMPEEMIRVPFKGPESRMMLFTACTEKGIAFKFDVKNTPARYRDLFWKAFADYVEAIRKILVEKKADMDKKCCSLQWFSTMEKYLQSKKDKMDMLGISIMS